MKTALVLSGGASKGAYELGVWKALRELGIKIDIVTGTSIGAMNATLVANDAYEAAEELWLSLKTEEIFDIKHVIENKGVRFTSIQNLMAEKIDEDYIRKSKTELGICTLRVLNPSKDIKFHNWKLSDFEGDWNKLKADFDKVKDDLETDQLRLWKEDIPKGKLLDYVFASCSCFPIVMPYEIDDDKYLDGGFFDLIPISMALQKNPDRIIAVDLKADGVFRKEDAQAAGDKLIWIRTSWDLGNPAVFDPKHAADIIRLGYLDTMKAFGAFAGKKYTFLRGQIPSKIIPKLEQAAELFGLDPKIIYTKQVFDETLANAIKSKWNSANKLDIKVPDKVLDTLAKHDEIAAYLRSEGLI